MIYDEFKEQIYSTPAVHEPYKQLITEDCLFPCDNDLEIPSLRLDMQPKVCSIPFRCFGEQKRTLDMEHTGTLHFYTDDYRFQSVYDHPEKILQNNPANIVEPNFSLFTETPIAFGLQAVYKKRMVARLMQENGIRVFVDLNVAPKFYKCNLIGVPAGYSAFCTRGYSDRLNQLEFEYKMARSIAGDNPLTFVVYGGGATVRSFCQQIGAIYVTPLIAIKNKAKSMKMIEETIAFHDEPRQNIIERATKQLLLDQVADFGSPLMIDSK